MDQLTGLDDSITQCPECGAPRSDPDVDDVDDDDDDGEEPQDSSEPREPNGDAPASRES